MLVLIVVKKEVWKKEVKNDEKGVRDEREENGNGRGGSLKTEENKTSEYNKQDIGSNTPCVPWGHGGGYMYPGRCASSPPPCLFFQIAVN